MTLRSRFAPSPTGLLHIGNLRSALLNWAFINNKAGEFILRIDDTDKIRSKKEYEEKIKKDLEWIGIEWNKSFNQSSRKKIYDQKIQELKDKDKIYPCFETEEELSLKRKSLLSSGLPPIYDRSSLNLSKNDINEYLKSGKKPHWRFKLQDKKIEWIDLIKEKVNFDSKNLSDPILIKEDGSFLYHLPSVIDDIQENITHIIRGEDHITNTAFHIQIFEAFDAKIPIFGHHPFIVDQEGKGFGKRYNSLSIENLRTQGFENLTLINYLLSVGTSLNLTKEIEISKIIKNFDISNLSNSSPKFSFDVLRSLNKDILQKYSFSDVKNRFLEQGFKEANSNFWLFIKNNIDFFHDSVEWREIVTSSIKYADGDLVFLKQAAELLPADPYNINTWDEWMLLLKEKTGKKGRDLFMPLRIALTGKETGPELKYLLPLLTKHQIYKKFGIIDKK